MVGEQSHQKGEDGVRRAKKWLDATTRVQASWTAYDDTASGKLEFVWPYGGNQYSYDLGGVLAGGDYHLQHFLAESKKYDDASDQGTHFDKFLAQSYVTLDTDGRMADHFMWITWAPFRITTWTSLFSTGKIEDALLSDVNRQRVFGGVDVETARSQIDRDLAEEVSRRIWVIVLSDKQETLVISDDERAQVVARRIASGR
ncbi:hypothetical protein ACPCUX_03700 [Cellulosimicrobium sp. AB352]|uniref:Uncharacterized protein n=1 Tax=Cellulosimicrobium funkei TaxID=264251 RepID=A0A4Y8R1H1_9MICO|nr:hypothetical protein [Cellulosimicrobium funkei]TFF10528.1 hypothetical protein E1O70_12155 [Cellulosimicrobium funkei]TGA73579.1 hypothetical protein EQW79_009675 [Cellulosimicrobium terreum]